jgi:hypothetical protein
MVMVIHGPWRVGPVADCVFFLARRVYGPGGAGVRARGVRALQLQAGSRGALPRAPTTTLLVCCAARGRGARRRPSRLT